MADFTKSITVENEKTRFQVSKIYKRDGFKFFVKVLYKNVLIYFDMQRDKRGDWKIINPAPNWLIPLESELASVIKKNIHEP